MKKKGFTLIELLAVILILGIIALIAIPTVTNIIEESKRGAFKTSVQNLLSAAEQDCQLAQLRGESLSKTYTFTDGKVDIPLNIKGDLPKSGTITVDNSCNVEANVTDGKFTATKSFDSDKIEIGEVGELAYTCKRATELHTEECTWSVEDILEEYGYESEEEFYEMEGYPVSEELEKFYCTGSGYATGDMIEYGRLGKQGEDMVSGDAFDCDIDGDGKFGEYDETTGKYAERFYYVSDYYNTTTKKFETDKATLIYYNNTTSGIADNSSDSLIAYNSDNKNYQGPVTLITNLPKRDQWRNPNLITGTRAIIGENSEISTSGATLPTAFDSSTYAARLLTTQELSAGCNNLVVGSREIGELDICNYLLENTQYSSSSMETNGHWLETPYASTSHTAWSVYSSLRYVFNSSAGYGNGFGARPAITILKSNISY